jgi:hypothetical protein
MSGAAGIPTVHGGEEVNAKLHDTRRGWPWTPIHVLSCADAAGGEQPSNLRDRPSRGTVVEVGREHSMLRSSTRRRHKLDA